MTDQQRSVTRTYRAAIRLGEDYITVEETITLPLGATDAEIQQAADLGLRIFQSQHQAVQVEVAQLRADTPATATTAPKPASDKQQAFIDTLARELGWDHDALAAFASEHGVAEWDTMTHTQASALIDAMKARKAAAEQQRAEAEVEAQRQSTPPHRSPEPAKQAQARQALAEAEQRAGVGRRQDLPPVGDRIRNPNDPATEAQITKIARTVARMDDADLKRLAPQIAAVLGYERVALKGLRDEATWPYLRDEVEAAHRLTKGRASQIIALLESATAEKAAA